MGSGCGAQLVERSLLTPEIHGLNPVISKLLYGTFTCLLSTVLKRRKQRKEAGNGLVSKLSYSWTKSIILQAN